MPQIYEWSKIPIEVNWVATDINKVWGFAVEPGIEGEQWSNPSIPDLPDPIPLYFLEPYPGNWKKSLEERPTT